MRKKETPNPSRVRGRGVEVSETLFYYPLYRICRREAAKKRKENMIMQEVTNYGKELYRIERGVEV
ncbi:hypothetical protein KFE17_06510 [Faecalicatena sp. Marseille-Q4148]|nr:hypothetical protein KFE17_06510 [Faecalicatena sp. Marseille-Q4148]